jgi:hypothetical protein
LVLVELEQVHQLLELMELLHFLDLQLQQLVVVKVEVLNLQVLPQDHQEVLVVVEEEVAEVPLEQVELAAKAILELLAALQTPIHMLVVVAVVLVQVVLDLPEVLVFNFQQHLEIQYLLQALELVQQSVVD